jgi:hypothetical protein
MDSSRVISLVFSGEEKRLDVADTARSCEKKYFPAWVLHDAQPHRTQR